MKYESSQVMSRLCASLLLILLMWSACVDPDFYAGDTVPENEVDIEKVDSVTIRYSDSATVQVIVRAPKLYRINEYGNVRQEFPEGTHVDFLEGGAINSTLKADYAIRFEGKSRIVVQNNVVWTSMDGKRLESEELIWDERTKKIHTQKLVHIVTPEQDIFGYGLEADQDFDTWKIISPIGDLKVDDLKN